MNDNKKRKFNKRMEALNKKYRQQLPEKYKELENSWKEYKKDLSNPDFIEMFYRLVHTLKGTAATFGFVKQSDICFVIQKILLTEKEQPTLSDHAVEQIHEQLSELKININTPAEEISEL
jgi:chemotaxis protein histidine kinase CheA